ncbi:MAG TPA: UDP-N-acetylmuramate:L-alanyl-gamma-D-glutamyl-meso-diaminopimelate ligase [Steroidobacteraceae bacterium]|nr:UDP-N-acetylmuramate:L-alanyl-gamma-D-glutamyl-meso-diaminopimelate ligase [Steroidobacteraceae bacterium]
MHVHILGICGTFMGGVAVLARAAGHRVSGSDRNVYPPMSTQLAALGIELSDGFGAEQLDPPPDVVVVGNVCTRGMPVIEALLESAIPYTSGPEWLSREVLAERWVLAVAGTHGKTTTAAMLAWILEDAGLAPGYLIGGIPGNFPQSARLGELPFFVIEADEYDTAFFDKRAKFVHYRPRTLILNNLEFDHADIYPDLGAIERQFHHLIRIVPGSGRIIVNARDANLARVLALGSWSELERFARDGATTGAVAGALWNAVLAGANDGSEFSVRIGEEICGTVRWPLMGLHNVDNALAAISAARHAGVLPARACAALADFAGVRRRMELRGTMAGISVYDDFAHHPTAIATTLEGLRLRIGPQRIVAVLEPRSHTMRVGTHRDTLADSLESADSVWLYAPADLGWDAAGCLHSLGGKAHVAHDMEALIAGLSNELRAGDHALLMSNGGFGALHERLLKSLAERHPDA